MNNNFFNSYIELAFVFLHTILLWFAYKSINPYSEYLYFVNILTTGSLATILLGGCLQSFVKHRVVFFTASFWFRIATVVYFCFGNIVPYLYQKQWLFWEQTKVYFSDFDILKFNLIVALCVLIILATYRILNSSVERTVSVLFHGISPSRAGSGNVWKYAIIFLVVGGVVRYLFDVPYQLGLTNFVLPGIVNRLTYFLYAAIFLLVLNALRNRGFSIAFTMLVVFTELIVSIATFGKTQFLLTVIVTFLAFLWHRVSLLRIVSGIVVFSTLYIAIVPVVEFGRRQMISRYQGLSGGQLEDRISIIEKYLFAHSSEADFYRVDRTLSRFTYTKEASYVIKSYDNNAPGDSYWGAVIVLIPRVIWPDKPIITDQGKKLYKAITGHLVSFTSVSPGLYAESYWNFGWFGSLVGMIPYALFLSVLTNFSILVMRQEAWLYLPIVFGSVQFGTRVDGLMTVDVVGAFGLLVALIVLLSGANFFYGVTIGKNRSNTLPIQVNNRLLQRDNF